MTWELSLAGLLIGLLVGMTGMGGGSLMTPLLVLVFGFKPTVAIGTDILHGAIFKSFGAWRHRSLGTVHAQLTLWMLLGSAPASIAGVAFAIWLERRYGDGFEETAAHILGAALIVGGLGFLVKTFVTGSEKTDAPFLLTRRDKVIALLTGLGGGFVVGLTSVGSGTFFGLVMLLVFPLTAAKVVGTDIFHAAALLWVAGAQPPRRRQRRSRRHRVAARGLDPRRPDREPGDGQVARAAPPRRACHRPHAQRRQAARRPHDRAPARPRRRARAPRGDRAAAAGRWPSPSSPRKSPAPPEVSVPA